MRTSLPDKSAGKVAWDEATGGVTRAQGTFGRDGSVCDLGFGNVSRVITHLRTNQTVYNRKVIKSCQHRQFTEKEIQRLLRLTYEKDTQIHQSLRHTMCPAGHASSAGQFGDTYEITNATLLA